MCGLRHENQQTAGDQSPGRLPASPRIDERIAADSSAPGRARDLVTDLASGMGDSLCENAALVVSELATNAVEHGSDDSFRVRASRFEGAEAIAPALRITVSNKVSSGRPGVPRPPWRMPAAGEQRGRGLAVVEKLSNEVEVSQSEASVSISVVVGG